MAIISLEEIEETLHMINSDSDLPSEQEINAVNNIESDITSIEEMLQQDDVENDETIRETVYEQAINLESYCNILIGCSSKELFNKTNTTLNFETINANPTLAAEELKRNLNIIKSNISKEDLEKVRVGMFERFINQFRTIKGEYASYKDTSKELLKEVKNGKFTIKPESSLDDINLMYLTELPFVCCKNLNNFYNNGIKHDAVPNLQSKIKDIDFTLFNGSKISDGLAPVGIQNYNLRGDLRAQIAPTGRKLTYSDTWLTKTFTEGAIIKVNKNPNFNKVEDVIKAIEFLDKDMEKCYNEIVALATSWKVKILDYLDVTHLVNLSVFKYVAIKSIANIFGLGNLNNLVHTNYHWVRQHAAQKALRQMLIND